MIRKFDLDLNVYYLNVRTYLDVMADELHEYPLKRLQHSKTLHLHTTVLNQSFTC